MNLLTAKKLLCINDINSLDIKALKKIWKSKIKEVHPDKVINDAEKEIYNKKAVELNTAYELVLNYIKSSTASISQSNKECNTIYCITLEEFINIYRYGSTLKDKKINKEFIRNNKILVQIDYKLNYGKEQYVGSEKILRTPKDEFNLAIKVSDNNKNNRTNVKISILDKELEYNMSSDKIILSLNFDFIVKINVTIERIDMQDG